MFDDMGNLWNWLASPTAAAWTAIGTWAAVCIAATAVGYAARQVKEARALREEQARPYVVAAMEQNPHVRTVVEITFKNYGLTAATNVRITSDPPLRRTGKEDVGEAVWLPAVIPTLAPGQEWRTVWDHARDRTSNPELGTEDRHAISVTYDGPSKLGYDTRSVLDWAAYKRLRYIDTKTSHHAAKSLEKIAERARGWTERGLRVKVDGIADLTAAAEVLAADPQRDRHPRGSVGLVARRLRRR